MTVENKTLVLDFVEWIAKQPRTYAEVMDAWHVVSPLSDLGGRRRSWVHRTGDFGWSALDGLRYIHRTRVPVLGTRGSSSSVETRDATR
jgi:hypothetical protein